MKLNKLIGLCAGVIITLAGCTTQPKQLVIVETNDSHSAVLPINGIGGYAARTRMLDSLRAENPNLLLVDDGDIFQGSPFFNIYGGRLDIQCYNRMGYEAMTLGNHEFDSGIDSLAVWLKEANFPIIVSNYDVSNTPLEGVVQPYAIIEKGGLKIGLLGLCVNPDNLILQDNIKGVVYQDPIEKGNEYAAFLKNEKNCDLVVCLSHLGYSYPEGWPNPGDSIVATKTRNIDIMLGGHTHKIVRRKYLPNADGDSVFVMQQSKSGKALGIVKLEY